MTLLHSRTHRRITAAMALYWALIAVLWLGWIALTYWMGRYGSWGMGDFRVYHEAAGYFARAESPYFGTTGMYFLYPPLLGQALIPLASLDAISAWQVWFALNLIVLIGTVALFSRRLAPADIRLLWLTPLLFEPILDSFYVGQVTILIFALLAGAWMARRDGRGFLAGGLIAAAAWLKVYPGFLALYFLWKRDWQTVRGIAVVGVALMGLQIAVSGVQPFLDSFGVVFDLAGGGQPDKAAISSSILGFTTQLFVPSFRVDGLIDSPLLFTLSRVGLTAALVLVLVIVSRRRVALMPDDRRAVTPFDLEFSLAVLTMMLLSPTLWASGMPPLLVCFWLLWRAGGFVPRAVIAFAFLLITLHSWFMIGYEGSPPLSALVLSFGFYALAALWGVNVWLIRSARRLKRGATP